MSVYVHRFKGVFLFCRNIREDSKEMQNQKAQSSQCTKRMRDREQQKKKKKQKKKKRNETTKQNKTKKSNKQTNVRYENTDTNAQTEFLSYLPKTDLRLRKHAYSNILKIMIFFIFLLKTKVVDTR